MARGAYDMYRETVMIWLLLAILILIAVAVYAILNSTPDF